MLVSQLKNYIFTTKIELDEETYIELREPTQKEMIGITDDDVKNMELLTRLFSSCVVDTSIKNDDTGEKATGKEIYDALKDSGSMMSEIINTWLTSIPFQHRLLKREKSGN